MALEASPYMRCLKGSACRVAVGHVHASIKRSVQLCPSSVDRVRPGPRAARIGVRYGLRSRPRCSDWGSGVLVKLHVSIRLPRSWDFCDCSDPSACRVGAIQVFRKPWQLACHTGAANVGCINLVWRVMNHVGVGVDPRVVSLRLCRVLTLRCCRGAQRMRKRVY